MPLFIRSLTTNKPNIYNTTDHFSKETNTLSLLLPRPRTGRL